MTKQNVVICGAGIAGISTAYHLAVNHGLSEIMLIDERPPLTLTSDKSSECYRNWWPGPGKAMVALMNHSIDLLEMLADQYHNLFHLNRRGYVYFTADPAQVVTMEKQSLEISSLGAGPLRIFKGDSRDLQYVPSTPHHYSITFDGADLILDQKLIKQHFPYITSEVRAALHVRRAGWFSAQQLGRLLLEQGKKHGVSLLNDRVVGLETRAGRITSVKLESGGQIKTHNFVDAAGPFLAHVAHQLDVQLPVYNELHFKVSMNDRLKIIPRDAPLLVWNDSQTLSWSEEEMEQLSEDEHLRRLLVEFPPGVHTRPEGGSDSQVILIVWEYQSTRSDPILPPKMDFEYPEIAMRGLSRMIPEIRRYLERPPRPFLDGGYYTKTPENRPLIGPMPVEGSWLIGALSGFGLMASMAAGELLALHILDKPLPNYASAFLLARYDDPDYVESIKHIQYTGQL